MLRLTITPGCTGRNPGVSPAMVILHSHAHRLAVFPLEHEAMVCSDLDRVLPSAVARQGVKGVARLVQIPRLRRRIEHRQKQCQDRSYGDAPTISGRYSKCMVSSWYHL